MTEKWNAEKRRGERGGVGLGAELAEVRVCVCVCVCVCGGGVRGG